MIRWLREKYDRLGAWLAWHWYGFGYAAEPTPLFTETPAEHVCHIEVKNPSDHHDLNDLKRAFGHVDFSRLLTLNEAMAEQRKGYKFPGHAVVPPDRPLIFDGTAFTDDGFTGDLDKDWESERRRRRRNELARMRYALHSRNKAARARRLKAGKREVTRRKKRR